MSLNIVWDGVNTSGVSGPLKSQFTISGLQAASFGLTSNATVGSIYAYMSTSATTQVTVRATVYTEQASAAQRSIKSSSANDASAGTGSRTVKVTYLDATMAGPFTETLTLNGTTPVNTVAVNIAYIEKMEVMTAGSTGGNAGTITLNANTGGTGTVIATIAINDNQTFWSHHYVPTGKTAYITSLRTGSTVAAGSTIPRYVLPLTNVALQRQIIGTIRHGTANSPMVTIDLTQPVAVPGPAMIFLVEQPDVTTASNVFVGYNYIEF